ncbi:MAG: hypothetical protein AB8I08_15650 [Sandaracinaceae bacterium]
MRNFAMVPLVLALGGLALGCSVVDRQHLDNLEQGPMDAGPTDSGTPEDTGPVDSGTPENFLRTVDRCGDVGSPEVLDDSTGQQLVVDTRSLTSQITSCDSRTAPGHDGFVAIDVTAGDQWHFHVIPDPSVADQDRDPFLYLLSGGCDSRDCDNASDQCRGSGDEHFAFVAPSDGRFYLGIDDRNAGGGQYLLEAIRLVCGDGIKVHGESCDGTANCDTRCREVLSETRPAEQIPNDNEIEANSVEFPTSGEITISGSIGGDLCIYPDVYTFAVEEGTTVRANILKSDGTDCDNPALTPFDMVLRTTNGDERSRSVTDGAGCNELNVAGLSAGTYLLYLEHSDPIEDRPVTYSLHLEQTL